MSRAISPELVLVDPELGRAERARMPERPVVAPGSRRIETTPATPSRGGARESLLLTLVVLSLGVNGWFVADALTGRDTQEAAPRAPVPVAAVDAARPVVHTAARGRGAAAERRLLLWLGRAPRGALPAGLVDARTRLPAANLAVSCTPGKRRWFRCTVHRAGAPRRYVAAVRYPAAAEGGALVKLLR